VYVVDAGLCRGFNVLGGMRGGADQRFAAKDCSRIGRGHGIESKVNAGCLRRERNIDTPIDEHRNVSAVRSAFRRCVDVLRKRKQLTAFASAFSNLQPVDSSRYRGFNGFQHWAHGTASIDHETQHGPIEIERRSALSRQRILRV
jgi:hypothetical protein